MRKQWILVANGSVARIFSLTNVGDPVVALERIDCPEGQLKVSEIERDRQGLERTDNSRAVVHFEPHTNTRKSLLAQFAHKLAQRLEEGLVDGEYDTFWLIAPYPLLNAVKVCLNRGVSYRLKRAVDADFTALDVEQLDHHLREMRASPEMGMTTKLPLSV